jgi:membrane protein required for colicin V production
MKAAFGNVYRFLYGHHEVTGVHFQDGYIMYYLDILVVIILGFCLVRGIFRGLIKELASIVGVLGGLYAAYSYYHLLARALSRWITNPEYVNILSCLLIFAVVYAIISVMGVMIKYFMNIIFLGWTDRLCGAFFGAVKGILVVAAVILILTTFLPKNSAILKDSMAARHIMTISAAMAKVANKEMKAMFGPKWKELNKTWQSKKR